MLQNRMASYDPKKNIKILDPFHKQISLWGNQLYHNFYAMPKCFNIP